MYECMDCGAEFETPAMSDTPEGECPECGSDDIMEVDDYYEAETVDDLMDELDSEEEIL